MKKLTVLTMIMAIAIGFSSCQKDELLNENALELRAKKVAATAPATSLEYDATACLNEPFEFDVVAVANSVVLVMVKVDGEWIQIYQDAKAVNEFSFQHTFTAEGTYPVRVKFGSGGFTELEKEITVINNCQGCENELTTELTTNGDVHTLVVKFIAKEDGDVVIQGGLTNGGNNNPAILIEASSDDLNRNEDHSGPGNSNALVTRWEGSVTACEEVTITITFTGGNGVGDWTAKRGDEELASADEINL